MAGLAFLILTLSASGLQDTRPQVASPDAAPPVVQLEDVEVQARRGVALVDPELELDGAQIDALGAYDIGEAIRRLSEDYALGEAPMIIVNGRRMADPGVFSGFPPDALVRIEVLPPEAAGLYGTGDPGRRVVNIVLQRRFASRDGRAELTRPAAGGTTRAALDLRRSSIVETRTRQIGLKADRTTALRAGERDLTRDPGGYAATLRPASENYAADLVQTGAFGDWSASLRANARAQESRSVSVRDGAAVESRRSGRGLSVTGGLNGDAAGWAVQLALNGRMSQTEQSGLRDAESGTASVNANLSGSRRLFELPAGPLTTSLSAQASRSRSTSESAQARMRFNARTNDLGGNLAIPLARGGAVGDLALSLGASFSESDGGRGENLNAAISWTPAPKMRLNASWATSTQSLSEQQRFEPEYYGEPIVVFDFLTGKAVEVLPILGGNPDIRQPHSDRIAVMASAGPFTAWGIQGGVNWQRMEAVDGIGSLPVPTPEVEAVFPDRFRRDADGRLVSIDQRPINFDSALSETLTTNLGAAVPLGRLGGERLGAVRVTFNHTWWLTESTTMHEGLPRMDRLAGDGGGLGRHQFGLSLDSRRGRWGVNAGMHWRGGYRIRRESGNDGPDDLQMSPFTSVDLRFNVQLHQDRPARDAESRARRGTGLQLEFAIANLFDARPSARLGDGRLAPGYGRDDQDPVGRTVLITLKRRL